jgi:hypothetical protein
MIQKMLYLFDINQQMNLGFEEEWSSVLRAQAQRIQNLD